MADYVIIVDFRLKPNNRPRFRRLVDANAVASLGSEPGCRRFDVLEPKGEADRLVLYEIYDDRAAFEAHLRTPHFAAFEAGTAAMVAVKTVTEFDLVCDGTRRGLGGDGKAAAVVQPD